VANSIIRKDLWSTKKSNVLLEILYEEMQLQLFADYTGENN